MLSCVSSVTQSDTMCVTLLHFKLQVLHFWCSDWFTKLQLSAHIPSHLIRKCIETYWKLKIVAENIQTSRT